MTSLWPRIEPLLGKVGKPARYIGCEDGAQSPVHAPHKTSWLLVYPDAYEIGLPNQGLQILYEISVWIAWYWERKEKKRAAGISDN